VTSTRDARIYRVNAWRELKGRPALTFDQPEPEAKPTQEAHPPEWWTDENSRQWHDQVWGKDAEWSESQKGWGGKMTANVRRGGAGTYTPLKPKVMAKWRETDPRPTPITFYDGKIDQKRASLPNAVKPEPATRSVPNAYLGRLAAAMGDK
jgi:hypothetical protein